MKRGIVLMNLGSPDSTAVPDVKRYLMEFLMDERVIDYPYWKRRLLVGGIIVPFRVKNSAHAYSTIWTREGSPLIVWTEKIRNKLQGLIDSPVEVAMRYGNPSMKSAYDNLLRRQPGLTEVIAVPMYPHYAMSSYETAVEHARAIHKKYGYSFSLSFIEPYYEEPLYVGALAERIRPYLQQDYDHILFSYHGIPERHLIKSDPTHTHCLGSPDCCGGNALAHKTCYRHQCLETMRLVMERLGVPRNRYSHSFQSRLGREPWLRPYTDFRLKEMPAEGIKKLLILCPAFVSDCLETLEEIEIRGKETFLEAGGEQFTMIPCLNDSDEWAKALAHWVEPVHQFEMQT